MIENCISIKFVRHDKTCKTRLGLKFLNEVTSSQTDSFHILQIKKVLLAKLQRRIYSFIKSQAKPNYLIYLHSSRNFLIKNPPPYIEHNQKRVPRKQRFKGLKLRLH
jgi:hypothetical protein